MKALNLILLAVLVFTSCTDLKIAEEKIICEFPAPFEQSTEQDQKQVETKDPVKYPVEEHASPSKEDAIIIPTDYDQIAELIPPGWTIVKNQEGDEIVEADFNQDGLMDVALLIEIRGDTTYDFSEDVMLIIALQDKNGQLEKVAVSGNLGGESISYTKQEYLWVKNGVLSYWHQSMRHHVEVKYRYDSSQHNFMLIGKEFQDYGSVSSPARRVSVNYLIGQRIIREQEVDMEQEGLVELPVKREDFETILLPLSMLDWENLYGQL